MKKCVLILLLPIFLFMHKKTAAQEFELQQLLLNVEKLAQLKSMLEDLKKGYEIVFTGYTAIKDLSEGSFDLHRSFLDGLLEVSPAVRNCFKVAGIIHNSVGLVREYKAALKSFRSSDLLTGSELSHIQTVYDQLIVKSLGHLEALATLLSPGELRMSDDERLSTIDSIDEALKDQRAFLRHFTSSNKLLLLQRAKEASDIKTSRKLSGLTN